MYGTKPCEFIEFGAMYVTKPYELGPEGLPPLCCRKSDESLRICIGEALDFEGPPKTQNNGKPCIFPFISGKTEENTSNSAKSDFDVPTGGPLRGPSGAVATDIRADSTLIRH